MKSTTVDVNVHKHKRSHRGDSPMVVLTITSSAGKFCIAAGRENEHVALGDSFCVSSC